MKKLDIRNKEIHFLVLFGLLALLFISVNFPNSYSPQGNTIYDDKLPISADISITIVSPTTNEYFDATAPNFIIELNDTADPMWYTIDNGITNITFTSNTTIHQGNWTAHADGAVTLTFYVNDSLSIISTASVDINKDTVAPSIDSIDSPSSGAWFDTSPPSYSLSITETNLDEIWYTLDGGTNNYTGAASGTIDSTAWTNAGQGAVTITFYANDSAGNGDFASVGVNKDSVDPIIDSIDSPSPGAWFDTSAPAYSLTITETNLDEIWYTLDGGTNNYTGAASGSIDSTAWTNAGQGAVTITFYANDSAGNGDFASVVINKDTVDPSLDSIGTPSPGSYHSAAPSYSLSITETNLDTIWYTLDAGSNNYTGAATGTIDSTAWTNAGQGAVTIMFYVNDSAGNWDFASVGVNKDSVDPIIDSIDSPLPGTWFDTSAPGYSLTITETNLDEIWYTLDGGTNNYTGAASGTIDSTAWTNAGDGVVTITFYVNDSAGNWDTANVGVNKDSLDPSIDSVDSPLPGAWYDSSPPSYSLSITEANLDEIWYTLDGGTNNYTGAASGTLDSTAWTNAGQGAVTITFYVNDSVGNGDFASVVINKDSTDPIIDSIDSPLPGTWFSSTPPSYSISITETNLDTIWYTLDGGTNNYTGASSGTIDSTAWTNAGQGAVTITFYANDSAGNWDTSSVIINRDSIDPSIDSIDSPSPGAWFDTSAPAYSLTITETNLDEIWYTLDGGTNNYTGASSGTIDSTAWTNAGQGAVTITFYANDSVGNWGFTSVVINKDSVDPLVDSIDSPLSSSNHSTPPSYSLSITEVNLDSIWYSLDGGTNNYTGASSGTIDATAWTNAGQGAVTITFYANDSAGNWDSAQVIVNKDSINPFVSISSPTGGQYIDATAPGFVVEIDDSNLDIMWYTIDGGLTNITFTVNGTIDQTEWTALVDGPITVIFYANDSAGNIAFDQVIVNKDTAAPIINIVSPFVDQPFGIIPPSFIVEINDDILDTMWYTINGGLTNFTFTLNGTVNLINWLALPNGPVTITFYANDTLGHINSASRNINKNADAPVVNIVSPTTLSNHGLLAPNFVVEITDTDLDTMWYTIDGGATNITFIANGTIDQTEWTAHIDGPVTLIFFANDSAGNFAFDLVGINKDTVAPTVNIVSPTVLQLFGVISPNFIVEIDDLILDTMWYSLDGGLTNITFVTNGTFNQLAWSSVPNGTVSIYFYANDLAGNEAFDSVIVRVDMIIPTITVNLPTGDSVIDTAPYINIVVREANIVRIWYIVGSTNIDLANNTDQQLNALIWDALPEGQFTIELYANDTAGNLNNPITIILIKDISAPLIAIVYPSANETYTTLIPEIRLTVSDTTLNTTWYSIVGSTATFEFTPSSGTTIVIIDDAAWAALSNGQITIVFYANDSLGNISSDSITINRNVPEPFDFIAFLLGPIGLTIMGVIVAIIVVVIVVKRRKTHKTSEKEIRKIESLWD